MVIRLLSYNKCLGKQVPTVVRKTLNLEILYHEGIELYQREYIKLENTTIY